MAKTEKLNEVKEYHKNPRHITPERKKELENNMLMLGDISGIVHDLNTNEIISGNQRSKIIKLEECEVVITEEFKEPTMQGTVKLGYVIWEGQKFNYRAVKWNDVQREKANITANALTGYWSHDILAAEWGDIELENWGLSDKDLGIVKKKEDKKTEAHRKLTERFVVPPFTVLDSRKGYWLERKKAWKNLIDDKGTSREGKLAKNENIIMKINSGVSIFDPVLLELVALWFCPPRAEIIDPFNGGFEKHFVFNHYKHKYTGVELRKEQYEYNNARIESEGLSSKCYNDDGQNVAKYAKPGTKDLLFSCPPYYDLEVYSDLKNDASNQGTYKEFLAIIEKAFTDAYYSLKENRFAAIVVGDVRDKEGAYRGFVDDVKSIFIKAGAKLYNEMIFIEPIGTLPQRVGRFMKHRKVGKCHQNVLIFYKGDISKIQDEFPALDYDNEDIINFELF